MNNINEKVNFIKKISAFTGDNNFLKEGNIYNIYINNANDNEKGKTFKVRLKFLRGVYALFEDLNFKSIRYYLRYSDYHLDCNGNDDICYNESIINSLKKTEFWSIEEVFDTYQNNIYRYAFNEVDMDSKKNTKAIYEFNEVKTDSKKTEIKNDNKNSSPRKKYVINDEMKKKLHKVKEEKNINKEYDNPNSSSEDFIKNIKEVLQAALGEDAIIKVIKKDIPLDSNNKKTETNKNKCDNNCNSCSCGHTEKKKESSMIKAILNTGHHYYVEGISIFGSNILGVGKFIGVRSNVLFGKLLEFDFGSYKSLMQTENIRNIIPID